MKAITYYRVSTQKQGMSGLGLEAQQFAVKQFNSGAYEVIHEYIEVESGKKNNRPQLLMALEHCKRAKAILLIAKLDRLARNVHFITGLMESKVKFKCVDMPEANDLLIHIIAAVAQHEREMISIRTKDALAAAKRRGTKLGTPDINRLGKANRAAAVIRWADHTPIVLAMHGKGRGVRDIARELRLLPIQVSRIIKRNS